MQKREEKEGKTKSTRELLKGQKGRNIRKKYKQKANTFDTTPEQKRPSFCQDELDFFLICVK